MKQTAVEWLVKEFDLTSKSPIIKNVVEQAEQMFKQQMMDAFYEGMNCQNFDPNKGRAEIYYDETFKKEMKLLLCKECQDIMRLIDTKRICKCC